MARLTAEFFAELPEELQQRILSEVPATQLNKIEVITEEDGDVPYIGSKITELLIGLDRREAMVCIMQLIAMITKQSIPPGLPDNMRLSADLAILQVVVAEAKSIIKMERDDGDIPEGRED